MTLSKGPQESRIILCDRQPAMTALQVLEIRFAIAGKLDGIHQADPTDIPQDREPFLRFTQACSQLFTTSSSILDQCFFLNHLDRCFGCSTGKGVPAVGTTMRARQPLRS